MRSLALLALALVACATVSPARADDAPPQKFFLIDGKVTTESRVTELEKRVAELEAKLAKSEKTAVKKPGCDCPVCECKPAPGGVGTCGSYACPANGGAKASATDSLPAYLTIEGQLHQKGANGSYYPVGGAPAPSYSSLGASYSGSSCAGGNCPLPSSSRGLRFPTIVK